MTHQAFSEVSLREISPCVGRPIVSRISLFTLPVSVYVCTQTPSSEPKSVLMVTLTAASRLLVKQWTRTNGAPATTGVPLAMMRSSHSPGRIVHAQSYGGDAPPRRVDDVTRRVAYRARRRPCQPPAPPDLRRAHEQRLARRKGELAVGHRRVRRRRDDLKVGVRHERRRYEAGLAHRAHRDLHLDLHLLGVGEPFGAHHTALEPFLLGAVAARV